MKTTLIALGILLLTIGTAIGAGAVYTIAGKTHQPVESVILDSSNFGLTDVIKFTDTSNGTTTCYMARYNNVAISCVK